MFTCSTRQDQFQTYVLQNESGQTYIEVVPERGCIISKYVHNAEPIFYLEQETLDDPAKNVRGGNPILFPISSYLVDETYYYNDSAYQLKQHGFARNLAGKVVSTHADEAGASITLEMTHNEETLARYPFHFTLTMKYTLDAGGLTVTATVVNQDDKTMPFYLGYHPYFYAPDKNKIELRIPSTAYADLEPNSMTNDRFNFDQAVSNVIYDQLQSNASEMIDHARNLKVTLIADDYYQYIVLWALEGSPFVCIEPWMAPVNGMNVNKGVQLVEAKQAHTSTIHIKVESIRQG